MPGDLKLCVSKRYGGARPDEIFGLVAKMAEVGTIGKLHMRNPFRARGPHESGERCFAMDNI